MKCNLIFLSFMTLLLFSCKKKTEFLKEVKEYHDNNNLKIITKNLIFSNSGEAIILKNNISKGIVLRGYQTKEFSNLAIIKMISSKVINLN